MPGPGLCPLDEAVSSVPSGGEGIVPWTLRKAWALSLIVRGLFDVVLNNEGSGSPQVPIPAPEAAQSLCLIFLAYKIGKLWCLPHRAAVKSKQGP